MRSNHEIDYKIHGEEMQCIEIELDPQETVAALPKRYPANKWLLLRRLLMRAK